MFNYQVHVIWKSHENSHQMLIFSKKHSIHSVTIIQSILERYPDIFLVIVYFG